MIIPQNKSYKADSRENNAIIILKTSFYPRNFINFKNHTLQKIISKIKSLPFSRLSNDL